MIITREWLEANSNGGSPNNKQLKLFGMRWPLSSGWRERLIGREINQATASAFVMRRKRRPAREPKRVTSMHLQGQLGPDDFQRGKEIIVSGLCRCDLPPWEACNTCPDRIAA